MKTTTLVQPEPDDISAQLNHSRFDAARIQAVVNKLWQMKQLDEQPPQISNYEDFKTLIPEMGKAEYSKLADAAFDQHTEVPLIIGGSSGTSGESKLVIEKTNTPGSRPCEDDIQLITELRMAGILGPGDIAVNLFVVGMYSILHHGFNRILEACYCSVIPLGMLSPEQVQKQLKFLAKHKANVLTGTPGTLIQIAHAVRQTGVKLNIERILYTGERMGEAKASVLRKTFPGVRIVGFYGLSECGFMAIEEAPDKYRVRENAYFLELNDAGRLLVTCLNHELPIPFVRFDTGDHIRFRRIVSDLYMQGIERADTCFNFIGNLIDVKDIRNTCANLFNLQDVLIEVELTTDSIGRDRLLVRLLADGLTEHDCQRLQAILLEQEEFKEAIEKGAGTIDVEKAMPEQAKLTGRNKHRQIIDLR